MSKRLVQPIPAACTVVILTAALAALVHAAPPQSDEALWAGADQRIERHRKADATITVVDKDDEPVFGVDVAVKQTRHAFLFGCNIFAWGRVGDEDGEAEYRRRFADVFNFATLGFYWQSYEPRQGDPQHQHAERVASWCKQQGIICKGHPLAWNYSDPRWLPDDSQEIFDLQLGRKRPAGFSAWFLDGI